MRIRIALPLLVAALSAALLVLLAPQPARADLKLDGRWRQTALREDFTIQQWLDTGCGPPPQSTSTGGGEVIEVRMEGDELAFVGGGRVFRTNQCYDPMPTLSRETHSRDPNGKSWRTRCTTAPTDPRKATLNTLVVATTEEHIDLVETGRYEITLESGRCMADVKRTRSFTLVHDDTTPTATATAAPPPKVKEPEPPRSSACRSPGDPSKLEVRPSKKLLRTGESFKFRGLVLDAQGCETRTATTWKVASAASGVTVDNTGRVTVAKDAAEGTVDIVATAAGKDARVVVEVVSPARYDELLARSGLNAAGENDEAASVIIASQSLGAGEGRVEDRSRERRMMFLGIVGAVLVSLIVVALVLVQRARKAKTLTREAEERHEARVQQVLDRRRRREAEHAAQMRAHEESVAAARAAAATPPSRVPMVCGSCGNEQPPGTAYCPHDGSPLTAASKAVPRSGGICPVCNKGFGPDVRVCPQDNEELLPSPMHAAMVQRAPQTASRGKICPTCGERFEGGAEFCGKDGTILVLLN
jgi:hypothetical protein